MTGFLGFQGFAGMLQQGTATPADPLAGIDFALRLQTHDGANVPLGLWQDIAKTIPAVAEWDPIAVWEDVLGDSGLEITQADTDKQPLLVLVDGVPTVSFDGVDDALEFSALPAASSGHLFAVLQCTGSSESWQLNAANNPDCYYGATNLIFEAFGSTVRRNTLDPSADLTVWNIYDVLASDTEWTATLNGVQFFTTGTNTFSPSSASTIGYNGVGYFTGSLAFFGIAATALAGGDSSAVRTYLGTIKP